MSSRLRGPRAPATRPLTARDSAFPLLAGQGVRIIKRFPVISGIHLARTVEASPNPSVKLSEAVGATAILVTGAADGVGSVAILTKLGYRVGASKRRELLIDEDQ